MNYKYIYINSKLAHTIILYLHGIIDYINSKLTHTIVLYLYGIISHQNILTLLYISPKYFNIIKKYKTKMIFGEKNILINHYNNINQL